MSDFYEDGTNLPRLHPDDAINCELLIETLCAKLDTARRALGEVSALQVVTPALVRVKQNAVWALSETHPRTLTEP